MRSNRFCAVLYCAPLYWHSCRDGAFHCNALCRCQEHIQKTIALSTRLDETKKWVRKLKKAVLAEKEKALPIYNEALANRIEVCLVSPLAQDSVFGHYPPVDCGLWDARCPDRAPLVMKIRPAFPDRDSEPLRPVLAPKNILTLPAPFYQLLTAFRTE